MAEKSEQRFSWNRNPTTGAVLKKDTVTGETFGTNLDEYPEVIQENFTVYGMTKIFDDRGSQVPPELKIEFCKALELQFKAGAWKATRTGGIHLLPLVIEAIMEKKNWKVAKAQEAYRKLDDAQRLVLKGNLADLMLAIQEAREKAPEGDLEDLLK